MRILAASAPAPAREKFTIAVGQPVTLALQYTAGKRVPSRIPRAPDQMFYTLADGRAAYLPLGVGQLIDELHLAPREPFVLRKNAADDWDVERVHAPEPAQKKWASSATAISAPAPGGVNPRQEVQPHHPTPAAFQAIPTSVPPTPPTPPVGPVNGSGESHADIMARCYCSAVDIALATIACAEKKGLRLTVQFEDVRAMGTAMMIAETGRR